LAAAFGPAGEGRHETLEPVGGNGIRPKEGEYVQPLGDFRYLLVQDWVLEPNPLREFVEIHNSAGSGMTIDQVVIDTRCVPEPATLCLLGAGVAGLAVRRIRRK
jgi:hypothetical protein